MSNRPLQHPKGRPGTMVPGPHARTEAGELTFAEAAATRIPGAFQQFGSQTLDEVASTDEGLLWLDRTVDSIRMPRLRQAFEVYLGNPTIQAELRRALR